MIAVAETVAALREKLAGWRRHGERIALVPTMGALHEGHLSLVRLARDHGDRVVVSIFVNPTQFAPTEDFSRYPRTFDADRKALAGIADLVFAPGVEDMYPPGCATTVTLAGPAAVGLEDRFRPFHFNGVATVVAKLLIQAMPEAAVFGEKDYQQLRVISRMVRDLHLPAAIVPGATVREPDGLAMSSRNRYLSPEERTRAASIYRVLRFCAKGIRDSQDIPATLAEGRRQLAEEGFVVDYLEARDAETLEPPSPTRRPLRLLAAAAVGTTRLIDNIPV